MNRFAERGFSLVEMLVVMMIIGILAASLGLSPGLLEDKTSELERTAEQLLNQLTLAQQEAVLANNFLGLRVQNFSGDDEAGWQFTWQRYDSGFWRSADHVLAPGAVPASVQVEFTLDGEQSSLAALAETEQPFLLVEPTGELPVFSLDLHLAESMEHVVLGSDTRGQLSVLQVSR